MKQFIIARQGCKLVKVTPRKEKFGKRQRVPAVTLKLRLEGQAHELLPLIDPTLHPALYWKPPEVEAQQQIAGMDKPAVDLRAPSMEMPIHLKHALSGYTVTAEVGMGDELELYECVLEKFAVEAKDKGVAAVEWNVRSNKEITAELLGALCVREGDNLVVTTAAAPAPASDGPLIDGSKGHPGMADAAKAQAERDAGDLFADANADAGGVEGKDAGDGGSDADAAGEGVSDQHAGDFGTDHDDDGAPQTSDTAGFAAEVQRGGENWPFPTGDDADGGDAGLADPEKDAAAFEAGLQRELAASGMKPKARGPAANDSAPKGRRGRRTAGGSVE